MSTCLEIFLPIKTILNKREFVFTSFVTCFLKIVFKLKIFTIIQIEEIFKCSFLYYVNFQNVKIMIIDRAENENVHRSLHTHFTK